MSLTFGSCWQASTVPLGSDLHILMRTFGSPIARALMLAFPYVAFKITILLNYRWIFSILLVSSNKNTKIYTEKDKNI